MNNNKINKERLQAEPPLGKKEEDNAFIRCKNTEFNREIFPKQRSNARIIAVREHPEYLERAADYFSSKWGVSRIVYHDCIANSLTTENPLPRWYLMLKENEIIGSYGLIVNDFISRQDLWPWLCAVYIEENERGQAYGSRLLAHGRSEAAKLGYPMIYLSTDHIGFYEKYGWRYICQGYKHNGADIRIYEVETISC